MKIFLNKKGSALMQVLVIGMLIAAIVVLLLRFSITRTSNIVKTTRRVAAKAFAEGCYNQFLMVAMYKEERGLPVLNVIPEYDPAKKPEEQPESTYTCSITINGASKTADFVMQPVPPLLLSDDFLDQELPVSYYKLTMFVRNIEEL